MTEPVEVEEHIDIPRSTGIAGFLRTLEEILKLPRVQSILVDGRGRVTYRRLRQPDERALQVNLTALLPSAIVRLGHVVEQPLEGSPIELIHGALALAALERFEATAWVLGAGGFLQFKQWCPQLALHNERLLGLPIYQDNQIGEGTLLLAASYSPRAQLVDCQRFYRIIMMAAA